MDEPVGKKDGQDTTEQKIFDAAREVFIQKGLDGAKMQEIADKAGINKALLHYYYRTKEKLYEMVAKAVLNHVFPIIRELLESEHPLEEKIRRFIGLYIGVISYNPFLPLFIITEMNKRPEHFFENIIPPNLPKPAVIIRQIEEAIAEGKIRPMAPQHILVNIISMCVFPFVAKPMMRVVLGLNPEEARHFLKERKEAVTDFVLNALYYDYKTENH